MHDDAAATGTPTEVMIWTNATFGQDGTNVGSFAAGGLTFTLYQTLPADYSWTDHPGYSFVATTQVSSVGLNLHAFLWHLVDAGYVSSSAYLTSVDAGIEIRNGTGSLTTTEYFTYVNLN
jgi:glycosyl hydrolase family 12